MRLKTMWLGTAAGVLALGMASAAGASTIINVGTNNGTSGSNFQLTNGSTPFDSSITAAFSDNFSTSTTFDDKFVFTIPQNGTGSGNISTSFAGGSTLTTITALFINGVQETLVAGPGGQSFFTNDIPITAFQQNSIEVFGTVKGKGGFSGNLSFQAVPEPATWALMIGGMGLLGGALRRRRVSFNLA